MKPYFTADITAFNGNGEIKKIYGRRTVYVLFRNSKKSVRNNVQRA